MATITGARQTSLNLKVVAITALKEDSTRVNAVDGSQIPSQKVAPHTDRQALLEAV